MRRIKRLLSFAMAGALMLCTTLSEALASVDVAGKIVGSARTASEAAASEKAESKKKAAAKKRQTEKETEAAEKKAEQEKAEKEAKSEKEVKLTLSVASPDGLKKVNGAYQVDPAEVRTLKLAWSCTGACDSYAVSVSGGVYSDTTTKTSVKLSVGSLSAGKYTATVKAVRDGKTVAKKSLSFQIVPSKPDADEEGAQATGEAEAPAEEIVQAPQGEAEAPAEENVQEPQGEADVPAEETVQEPQGEAEAPAEETVQAQQGEAEAPAGETVQEPQGEADVPAGETVQEPQGEVETPAEETVQEPQGDAEAPAGETVEAQQGEAETPSEETAEAPAEETVQSQQGEADVPADDTPQAQQAPEEEIIEASGQALPDDQNAPDLESVQEDAQIAPQVSESEIALDAEVELDIPDEEPEQDDQIKPDSAGETDGSTAPDSQEVSNAGEAREIHLTLSIIGMPGLSVDDGAYRIDPTQASAVHLAWDCDGDCDGYSVKVSGGAYSGTTKDANLTLPLDGLADGGYTATVTALVNGKKAAKASLKFEIATPGDVPGEEARLSMTVAAPQGLPITDGAYQVDAADVEALTLAWECSEACDSYAVSVSGGIYSDTTAEAALTLPLEGLAAGRYTVEVIALMDGAEVARSELAFEVVRSEALTLSITDPKGLAPTDGVYVIDPSKVTSLTFAWQTRAACEKYRVAVSGDVYSAVTTDTALTLPLEKLAAGQYTLTVEAMKGDRAVARAELTFRIDDAGQKPEGQQPQGSMPKRSGAQGGAQGDGAEAAQGFRVTPGEALVSTHISGTRDMRIYGAVALTLDTDGAMTELVLGGTPLGIVLDGGDAAFTGIIEGDTLTLAAEAGEIWTLNGRALKTLSVSGIARLVLCAGTGRVELDTAQALQGDVYARLRGEGFVSGDYNYQISDAGILITVAGSAYRLGDAGELTPMEGDGSAETMVYSAGGAV